VINNNDLDGPVEIGPGPPSGARAGQAEKGAMVALDQVVRRQRADERRDRDSSRIVSVAPGHAEQISRLNT
jgi:hypothetical protein